MHDAALFSAEDFRRRVAERFGSDGGIEVGDHLFSPEIAEAVLAIDGRPAAVLVPIVHREPEATVLLTLRATHLRMHAGQIAFPGGRIDESDSGAIAAALREAEEEIGLDSSFIEALATGPDYLTTSGYRITPVLALIRPDFQLRLNPDEVSDAFEVPLSFLMDSRNHGMATRTWQGVPRRVIEVRFDDRLIAGITAGILRVIYDRLYASDGELPG